MRQGPEHFCDQELALIYIAKQLKDALRLETVLSEAGLDYLVEPDKYSGGIIFQSERVGAFFYVAPGDQDPAKDVMSRNAFRPYKVE